MRKFEHWQISVVASCFVLGLLMIGPQVVHMMHPAYEGIFIPMNSSDNMYMARIQESLQGRGERADEPFIGDPGLKGIQLGPIEGVEGALFSWTFLTINSVIMILDILVPILVFLSLLCFFRHIGFDRWYSFYGATGFSLLQLYNLNNPVHPRESFLLLILTLVTILFSLEKRMYWTLVAGALLGVLVGVYFWSWTFAWIFWGIYFGWELVEWAVFRYTDWAKKRKSFLLAMLSSVRKRLGKKTKKMFSPLEILSLIGIIGIITSLPPLFDLVDLMQYPDYTTAMFRSGAYVSHIPESAIFTVLFGVMVVASVGSLWNFYDKLRPYRAAFVMIFAAFIFLNQQIFHGTVFLLASRGVFALCAAAICAILLTTIHKSSWLKVGAVAAGLYLLFIAVDNRFLIRQWRVSADQYTHQNFARALNTLEELPRSIILSDPETSALIANYTKHDITYSVYLSNVLMSNEEIAQRFCLTQVPLLPEERHIEDQLQLVHPDANDVAEDSSLHEAEIKLVSDECAQLDQRPAYALDWFGVEYIFWDEKNHPTWQLGRYDAALEEVEKGDGWSLWRVL